MQTIDTMLVGLGNVNRNFLKILEMKGARLRSQYDLTFRIVCVADSSGVAINQEGFEPTELRQFKERGGRVCDLDGYVADQNIQQVLSVLPCDLVMEGSPVNLEHGEPGLSVTRTALERGINVVLANKGPLVLAFRELHEIAARTGAGLAFSATVCGALPVINIGRRDLIAADVTLLRGIFNSTSNFILGEMAEGRSYAEALAEAQARGIAEADPALDVEGWDTANKMVIIANSFLGVDVTLSDISVQGITQISAEQLQEALVRGRTIKLLATASATPDGYVLSVEPVVLNKGEFLAGCDGWEMGIEIHSDLYGKMYYKLWEREPLPTAAAMLRDAVNLFVA
ncbi:MAG: homoserine dehydrogenase [Caldilineaceae bacterium]